MPTSAAVQPSPPVVVLTGHDLSVDNVVAVARARVRVALDPAACHRLACGRAMVDVLLERREKVYGLTTGLGKLRDVFIDPEQAEQLQANLIRSHACGVGRPFDEDVVRAAILLRANTLLRGYSGVRPDLLAALVCMLNDDIYPYVPSQGSVGASGDLCPLAHVGLVLMGDPHGRVLPRGTLGPDAAPRRDVRARDFVGLPDAPEHADAFAAREGPRFHPMRLAAKEGVALINGTQFMTAHACLALADAALLLRQAEWVTAMSAEAQRMVPDALRDEIHAARNLPHQREVARRMLSYVEGSEIMGCQWNTGRVNRARFHLSDALTHLRLARRRLPDEAARSALDPALVRIEGHTAALAALISPEEPTAGAPCALPHRDAPPREQLAAARAALAPLRADIGLTLAALEAPDLPGEILAPVRDELTAALRELTRSVPISPPVQDDYSFRCAPQVLATVWKTLDDLRAVVEPEINAATDNPLLFPPEPPGGFAAFTPEVYAAWLREPARAAELWRHVLGGGNFHGQPLAAAMDAFAIAVAEIASISERRIAHLVDDGLSNGLPPFLVHNDGLNSGFMIPQYVAAALVSENKVLCHPASVDSIPTCAGVEDHVSMGSIAARKAMVVLAHARQVVAIELLAANEALAFRGPLRPAPPIRAVLDDLAARGFMRHHDADRVYYPLLQAADALLASGWPNVPPAPAP